MINRKYIIAAVLIWAVSTSLLITYAHSRWRLSSNASRRVTVDAEATAASQPQQQANLTSDAYGSVLPQIDAILRSDVRNDVPVALPKTAPSTDLTNAKPAARQVNSVNASAYASALWSKPVSSFRFAKPPAGCDCDLAVRLFKLSLNQSISRQPRRAAASIVAAPTLKPEVPSSRYTGGDRCRPVSIGLLILPAYLFLYHSVQT